jgi:exopolysaccharide biosynthesis protein
MWPRLILIAILSVASAAAARAQSYQFGPWQPLYTGLDLSRVSGPAPGIQRAEVLRIDLTQPGISFVVSPQSGVQDTESQTTAQFLISDHAQVAINANLFWPCCSNETSKVSFVYGLVVRKGAQVAPQMIDPFASGTALLVVNTNKQVSIQAAQWPLDLSGLDTVVAGSAVILADGKNIGAEHNPTYADPLHPNPRTLAGLSQDARYLYLATIDGGHDNGPGATMVDAAAFMSAAGAWNALNLDGGGSTTMVQSDGKGGATLLNEPKDCDNNGKCERYVAVSLGVFAAPLARQR